MSTRRLLLIGVPKIDPFFIKHIHDKLNDLYRVLNAVPNGQKYTYCPHAEEPDFIAQLKQKPKKKDKKIGVSLLFMFLAKRIAKTLNEETKFMDTCFKTRSGKFHHILSGARNRNGKVIHEYYFQTPLWSKTISMRKTCRVRLHAYIKKKYDTAYNEAKRLKRNGPIMTKASKLLSKLRDIDGFEDYFIRPDARNRIKTLETSIQRDSYEVINLLTVKLYARLCSRMYEISPKTFSEKLIEFRNSPGLNPLRGDTLPEESKEDSKEDVASIFANGRHHATVQLLIKCSKHKSNLLSEPFLIWLEDFINFCYDDFLALHDSTSRNGFSNTDDTKNLTTGRCVYLNLDYDGCVATIFEYWFEDYFDVI